MPYSFGYRVRGVHRYPRKCSLGNRARCRTSRTQALGNVGEHMGTCVPAVCTRVHKMFPRVQNVPGVWNVLHRNAWEHVMYPGTKRGYTCTRKAQRWQQHGNKSWGGGTRVSLGEGLYDLIYPPWHSPRDVSMYSTLPVRVRPIVPLRATLFCSLVTHWALVLLRVKGYGSGYCSMFIVIGTKALHMECHPAHAAMPVGFASAPFAPHAQPQTPMRIAQARAPRSKEAVQHPETVP